MSSARLDSSLYNSVHELGLELLIGLMCAMMSASLANQKLESLSGMKIEKVVYTGCPRDVANFENPYR